MGTITDGWEPHQEKQPFHFEPVSGRLWRRAGSGSTRFRRFPEKVCEALVQSQVRLDRPEKVPEKFWCKAKSSSMGSGEGLGGFGAQPGQVQQGFREGSVKGRT